jgi:PhzF family phenazine biosynthesis protein
MNAMFALMNIEVQILNAFVDEDRGGNPAGVVLNADKLSHTQKLQVARQVGLPETAFVSRSQTADFKLDFFTPTMQIAHCGHATIATFSYLSQLGKIKSAHSSKETIDGNRAISLIGNLAFMEQTAPQYSPIEQQTVLDSLNLSAAESEIMIVDTGNSFAIIQVKDVWQLRNLQPNYEAINRVSEVYDLVGYYVFCKQASTHPRDATTRMFAPRYGIKEEAGTGMAAGPLGCYLYDKLGYRKTRFLIEQGWFMAQPSPSLLMVSLAVNNDMITKVMTGGKGMPAHKKIVFLQ